MKYVKNFFIDEAAGEKLWIHKLRDKTGKTFTLKSTVQHTDKEVTEKLYTFYKDLINRDGTFKRDFELYSYYAKY
tara:strand:+ start:2561 stop:2785 length:225 start_codon:yes stop_codon:yes gene_type:complete